MRKLSMLFAAAVMAFAVQTAWAAESENPASEPNLEQADAGGVVGRWRDRNGPRGGHRNFGHGPAMARHMKRGDGHGMGMGMGGMMLKPRLLSELDLTEQQIDKIIDLMAENYRDRLKATLERYQANEKLADLHRADSADHDAIMEANQAVGTAQGKLDVLKNKFRTDLKSVLTPEQQQKMDDFRKDRKDRFDGCGPDRDGGRDRPRDGKGPRQPHMMRGPGPRMMDR